MHKALLFCPLTCLRHVVMKNNMEESQILQDCFHFEQEVQPGWIQYDPEKITVLSCNDNFHPMAQIYDIADVNKQMVTVKNEADLKMLNDMLDKPVMMCVTRRHYCPNIAKTGRADWVTGNIPLNLVERELRAMKCFDMDFAVIFPPGVLRKRIVGILRKAREKIAARRKYCFMIDIKQMMKELTPPELQDADSLEYVSWHNTAFWLTNHCKPHHSLMYVNGLLFWTVMFPFALFVALPYRGIRKILCKDTHVHLRTPLKFIAEPTDTVAVYVWFTERSPPAAYEKHAKHYSVRAAEVAQLKPFLRDCNIVAFNFGND